MSAAETYDQLADYYDLIFEDWNASIERQAETLRAILSLHCGLDPAARILDCACGIGTQALGLAKLGFHITGSDISPNAIRRAQREAVQRGLQISFHVADMLNMTCIGPKRFDAVICMDNSLPHMQSEDQLRQAAGQIRARLHHGGVLLASIRDYDAMLQTKPVVQGPSFYSDQGNRRIVFQLWDWIDERRYAFHLYITRHLPTGWETFHTCAVYRAWRRDELAALLSQAQFRNVRWLLPAESGFYQPIIVAEAC